MTEKKSIIDRGTLIPLGLVMAVAMSICGAVWYTATLNSRVTMNTGRVQAVENRIVTVPTRNEFDNLKMDIIEIKQDIKTLLSK